MRPFFIALFSFGLFSSVSMAAECIGNTICPIIDEQIRARTGISLNNVLDNIDSQITHPIIENQEKLVLNEMSQIKVTPRGTTRENETRLSLHLGGNIGSVIIDSNIFNVTNVDEQFLGTQSATFLLEQRINRNNDLIVNIGYWNGSSDLGTGLLEVNTDEKNIKLLLGDRYFFSRGDMFGSYLLGALSIGGRNFSLSRSGQTIEARFNRSANWKGEEKYDEKILYGSAPFVGGIYLSSWGLTLSAQLGLIASFSNGRATISKFGIIGPLYRDMGYFNVGAVSTKELNSFALFQYASTGLEYSFDSGLIVSAEFRPKFGNAPIGGSIGVGWSY